MRTLVAVLTLALALVSSSAYAQFCTVAQAVENPGACGSISLQLSQTSRVADAQRLTEQHHDALVMRNSGIAITVIGSIATVIGASLMYANFCDNCSGTATAAGVGLLSVGQLGVAAGIPLWAIGGARAAKAERAMLTLSAGGAKVTF
jgi:hypothetical protein